MVATKGERAEVSAWQGAEAWPLAEFALGLVQFGDDIIGGCLGATCPPSIGTIETAARAIVNGVARQSDSSWMRMTRPPSRCARSAARSLGV